MKKNIRKATFILMAILCLVMVAATCIEKYKGSASMIYGSWWFASLWALLVVLGLVHIGLRKLHNRPTLFLLHLSFVIILAGALVTHIWGKQGAIHLRELLPERSFFTENHRSEKLPFSLTLEDFEVLYYPDMKTAKDYVSTVSTNGEQITISMNNIGQVEGYRFYQSSYDSDLHGTVLSVCYDPWGIGITYVGYGLLFLSMLLLLILPNEGFQRSLLQLSPNRRQNSRRILWGLAAVATLSVLSYLLYRWCMRSYADGYLPPVLRSPLLTLHVGVIMIAYVLFIILSFLGLAGLVLNEKRSEKLQYIGRVLLYPALFCLTAGIFIGAIWANISWGRYWGWDPKEVWALITLLVYCFALHAQSLPWFRSARHLHLFLVLAFLTVLMTYFGVNFLLGGMHSYA